jgi:5-methyltetrahydrofolate--homocysteine methyltransferase
MAPQMKDLVAAGANMVGGCCGTTPEHITQIVSELAG